MAKATRLFFGTDSYGRHVELAQSISGVWFGRHYGFNGYAQAWSKWYSVETPSFQSESINEYTKEVFKHEPKAFWGFSELSESDEIPRYRLPA